MKKLAPNIGRRTWAIQNDCEMVWPGAKESCKVFLPKVSMAVPLAATSGADLGLERSWLVAGYTHSSAPESMRKGRR